MLDRDELEQEIIQHFRVVFQAIQRHSHQVEKTCGVSSSQLWAMTELSLQPGLRVSDIASRLGIKISTASNMLDKIQAKKLVERKREQGDQRVVKLYLTAAGENLITKAPVPAQGAVLGGLSRMSMRDVSALNKSLNLLVSKMHDSEEIPANIPVDTIQ